MWFAWFLGFLKALSHPWGPPETDGGKEDKDACGVSWQIAEVGGTLDQPGNVGPGRGMYSPESGGQLLTVPSLYVAGVG